MHVKRQNKDKGTRGSGEGETRGLGDKETGRQGEMERKFVQRSPRFFCDFSGFSVYVLDLKFCG